MSSSAKDLLDQADRLIRRPKAADDLPVLTDMVGGRTTPRPTAIPDLNERVDDVIGYPPQTELPEVESLSMVDFKQAAPPLPDTHASFAQKLKPSFVAPPVRAASETSGYSREQFDQAILAKLEQMQHSVYSQVMQQLELNASGEMKRKLRDALEPALIQVSKDIATQVAEETASQVQALVGSAVEAEVARLREQLQNKKR